MALHWMVIRQDNNGDVTFVTQQVTATDANDAFLQTVPNLAAVPGTYWMVCTNPGTAFTVEGDLTDPTRATVAGKKTTLEFDITDLGTL